MASDLGLQCLHMCPTKGRYIGLNGLSMNLIQIIDKKSKFVFSYLYAKNLGSEKY